MLLHVLSTSGSFLVAGNAALVTIVTRWPGRTAKVLDLHSFWVAEVNGISLETLLPALAGHLPVPRREEIYFSGAALKSQAFFQNFNG